MTIQRVQRRSNGLRAALLALEALVMLFAAIFFALLIEYTDTSFRIVPLRAAQLAVSVALICGIGKLRRLLGTAFEYRFSRSQLAVIDVRQKNHPVPLWSLDPDAIVRWGDVGTPDFAQLLENRSLERHDYFVHRRAALCYIHYRDYHGEGMAVIEPNEDIRQLLERIRPLTGENRA